MWKYWKGFKNGQIYRAAARHQRGRQEHRAHAAAESAVRAGGLYGCVHLHQQRQRAVHRGRPRGYAETGVRADDRGALRLCRDRDGDIRRGAEGRRQPRARLVGTGPRFHAQRAVRDTPRNAGNPHGGDRRGQARLRERGQPRPRDILVRPAQDVVPHALQQNRGHARIQQHHDTEREYGAEVSGDGVKMVEIHPAKANAFTHFFITITYSLFIEDTALLFTRETLLGIRFEIKSLSRIS